MKNAIWFLILLFAPALWSVDSITLGSPGSVPENATLQDAGPLTGNVEGSPATSFTTTDAKWTVRPSDKHLVMRSNAAAYDFESTPTVSVSITADSGGTPYVQSVTITIVNVNEAPTGLNISNSSCNEETLGATIGTLSATDPDAGSTFVFSVPNNSGYAISGTTLKLADNRQLDFEDASVRGSYASRSVTVTVTDNGGLTRALDVTVIPTDVNEVPNSLVISNNSCNEETLGATIGYLSATDPDANSTFIYSVPTNSGYAINGTTLKLADNRQLDFEDASVRGNYASRSVTVTVTDNGGLTRTLDVTVIPTDGNDAPTALAISNNSCNEETLGATIGTLSATDPDVGATFVYNVPGNSGYTVNGTTLKLADDRKLDFEDASVRDNYASRSVTVTVTDNGGATRDLVVTVTPTNVNEAPTALAISNNSCNEEALGATIGTLSGTDPDAGSAFVYSVPNNSGYAISGNTLQLASDRKLDFEDSSVRGAYASRSVTVTVTDNGTPGLTRTLDVVVAPVNINEAPSSLIISNSSCAEETLGATIGDLSASDPDANSSFTYSVPTNSGYIIDNSTLKLAVDRKVDLEDSTVRGAYASRTVTVTVTDNGTPRLTKTLDVTVAPTNINEAPTSLTISSNTCDEETLGATIGILSAVDPDTGDSLAFSVPGGSGYRIIDVTGGKALALRDNRKLDVEDASVRGAYASRDVTVTVTDRDGLTKTLDVRVTPVNVNDAPDSLTIASSTCPEETVGATIGVLSASDPDVGDTLAFSVPATSGYRIIDVTGGKALALAVDKKLDLEDATVRGVYVSRTVTVTVTDSSSATKTLDVTVTPSNVNEAPTALVISDVQCQEESAGETVGNLTVTDVDVDDSHDFSVPVDSGYRIVDGNKLALAANLRLDNEDATVRDGYASREVTVTVTDSGGLLRTLAVTVQAQDANDPLYIGGWSQGAVALVDLESPVFVAPSLSYADQDPEVPLTSGGESPQFARYHGMKLRFKLTNNSSFPNSGDTDTADQNVHQLQYELPSGSNLRGNTSNRVTTIVREINAISTTLATVSYEGGNAAILQVELAGSQFSGPHISRAELSTILRGIAYRTLLSSGQGVQDIYLESSTERPWNNYFREWTGWRTIRINSANRRPTFTDVNNTTIFSAKRGSVGTVDETKFAITDDYPTQGVRIVVVFPPREGRFEALDGSALPLDDQGRPFLVVAPAAAGTTALPYVLTYRPNAASTAASDQAIVQIFDGGVPPTGVGQRSSELFPISISIQPGEAPSFRLVMDDRTNGQVVTYIERGDPAPVLAPLSDIVAIPDPLGAWTVYLGPPVVPPAVFGNEATTRYVVRQTANIRTTVDGGVECRLSENEPWQRIGTQSGTWTGNGRSLAIDLNPETTKAQAGALGRALGVARDGRRLALDRTTLVASLGFVATGVNNPTSEQISRQNPVIGIRGVNDRPAWTTPDLVLRTTSSGELVGISEVRDYDGGSDEGDDWTVAFTAVRRLRDDNEIDPADGARVYRFTWSVTPAQAIGAGIVFSDGIDESRQAITVQEVGASGSALEFVSDAPYFQRLGERRFVNLLLSDGLAAQSSGLDYFLTFPDGTTAARRDAIVARIQPIPASGQLLLDFAGNAGGLVADDLLECSLVANRAGADGTAVQPIKLKLLPPLVGSGVAQ